MVCEIKRQHILKTEVANNILLIAPTLQAIIVIYLIGLLIILFAEHST